MVQTPSFIGVLNPFVDFVCCVYLRIFRFPGRTVWEKIPPSFHSIDGWVMDPSQPRQRVEDALPLEEVDMTGSWMRFPYEENINKNEQYLSELWSVVELRGQWIYLIS